MSKDFYLAHCISADCALGAGIAVEFESRFNLKESLKKQHLNSRYGAILIGRIFNLVTKDKYWHKPTYDSVKFALEDMKVQCEFNGVKKLAMPKIASGLDQLNWFRISEMIQEVFQDTDIEIQIKYLK